MEQLTGTLSGAPNSNDYEKMNHKPQINGVELVGNRTSEEAWVVIMLPGRSWRMA